MRKALCILLAALVMGSSFNPSSAATIIAPVSYPTDPDPVKEKARAAFEEFKALSKKERKNKLRLVRKAIKEFKAAKEAGKDVDTNTLLLVIIAILLPPLAVYLHQGEVNNKFWITLLLFVLGLAGAFFFSWLLIFAAVVYALIVVLGGA